MSGRLIRGIRRGGLPRQRDIRACETKSGIRASFGRPPAVAQREVEPENGRRCRWRATAEDADGGEPGPRALRKCRTKALAPGMQTYPRFAVGEPRRWGRRPAQRVPCCSTPGSAIPAQRSGSPQIERQPATARRGTRAIQSWSTTDLNSSQTFLCSVAFCSAAEAADSNTSNSERLESPCEPARGTSVY